jgi:hypothetical protein
MDLSKEQLDQLPTKEDLQKLSIKVDKLKLLLNKALSLVNNS